MRRFFMLIGSFLGRKLDSFEGGGDWEFSYNVFDDHRMGECAVLFLGPWMAEYGPKKERPTCTEKIKKTGTGAAAIGRAR
ncbi:hypothetical protein PUV54_16610 [Hyphococcus flavus]|uniref:Uncharacterized protein n=1 Tax=Hyphococcus flavus TaxID=1866326 RepID=A0AAE9ZJC5_9PROT|nr:hypothetical protein [Hyphococcus flavus]WDI31575.1 hypothetical protein PUV54_16610 [Hyphococcus flavus]